MPAATADTLTLPRIAGPVATDTERPIGPVTTGPRAYEGQGFEPSRARGATARRSTGLAGP